MSDALFISPPLVSCWCKLFMCVSKPSQHWSDTLKLVESQIQKWKEGRLIKLWDDVRASMRGLVFCTARVRSNSTSAKHLCHCNTRRARQAMADDQYKRAVQSLTSMGFTLPTAEVLNEMLAKHPSADPSTVLETPIPPPVTLSIEQVACALVPSPPVRPLVHPAFVPITRRKLCRGVTRILSKRRLALCAIRHTRKARR